MVLSSGGWWWWWWWWCPCNGPRECNFPLVPNQQMVVFFPLDSFRIFWMSCVRKVRCLGKDLKTNNRKGPWTVRVSRFSLFVFEILCLPCIRQFSWPMDQDDGMAA
ncbi:hypothetical protein BDP55DRAFT_672688 [Colletotrichum godetiae]|uniref:Secreted protein n=1 Tax=Colletotrichum godetiae TaxID=1209918 RepID=A0AAJ0EUS4_9PEZI|nr:uncharacterized protein BDP55DRAFT_672688 [Colletotrichum godetiae]KAK1672550.1 hypothetical protein BDP55DRAFT_672688 [Colletotrichum godetiae]